MENVEDFVEGLNNINVTRWLAGAAFSYTAQDAKECITETIKNGLYFAIVLKSEDKVIGGT